MKKLFFIFYFSLFITHYSFSQSGWYNTFFNNTYPFTKIVKRDSLNYFAYNSNNKYYYLSSNSGNNWFCYKENYFDSSRTVLDCIFLNSQTGLIAGINSQSYRGVLLKTTNGGINWIEKNLGTSFNISEYRNLCFLNMNTGWVGVRIYPNAYLFKTTNGGENWSYTIFPNSFLLNTVVFKDIMNGWVMGYSQFLANTTDGGVTWNNKTINNIPSTVNVNYTKLFPVSNNELWALASSGYGPVYSYILKSTNGGNNWALNYLYTDSLSSNSNSFRDIYFQNSNTGFVTGTYSFFMKTTNSGINWTRIYPSYDVGFSAVIHSVLFSGNNDIFGAGGNYDYNYIIKSTNAGLNWVKKHQNWDINFRKIRFSNYNTGFAIADTGRIYRTTNAGINWDLNFYNNSFYFKDISFKSSSTGFAISSDSNHSYFAKIFKTTNAGNNWIQVYSKFGKQVFSLCFLDNQTGFVGCDTNRLLYTSNSGLNWGTITIPNSNAYNIDNIFFLNQTTGWIFGYYYISYPPHYSYSKSSIWKSTNSGLNWSIIYDSVVMSVANKVQFLNDTLGYKATYTLFKTNNGGVNWVAVTLPIISSHSFHFLDQNTGWVSGGNASNSTVIIKTTNAGITWFTQLAASSGQISSLYAFDNDNAWFCGYENMIYKTTDGGGNIGIKKINSSVSSAFSLSQNYPNPFNPTTNIKFSVENFKVIKLIVYDILGKEVSTLVNEKLKPGEYEVTFDGNSLSSGIYFYSMYADGNLIVTKKMLLIK